MNLEQKISNYLEYCRYRKELDEKTIKAYRIDLNKFFCFAANSNPNKECIENFITYLHKSYKQKTVKRKIASVKAFYAYLEDEDIIEVSPFRRIKVKFKEAVILPRIIPRNDIERLLNNMYSFRYSSEHRFILRDIAVVEVLFATGARIYEISNLKKDCFDLNTGFMRIMGKGDKERVIQIADSEILGLLQQYYNEYKEKIDCNGYFFINRLGKRFTEQSIREMIKKYSKLAGIETKITPHMFRHSVATYLIEEGADISCIQRILGHSSIKTTQIYIHISMGKQIEVLKTLHPRKNMNIITGV